ncbi:MAG: hypothetical protein MJ211_05370 [Bacteroidales bacterium]|nr:hypothetical protein [Bacteroidales bacterium]
MDTTNLKCPMCGTSLKFDVGSGMFKCDFCGSSFSDTEINQITEKHSDSDVDINKSEYKNFENQEQIPEIKQQIPKFNQQNSLEENPNLSLYHCKNCGAEMVTDPNTSSTFCVYCGSTAILKSRLEGEFRPKYIIPFSKTKEDAIKAYNIIRKGKFLAPNEFGKESNIQKITGVYIPFWLYSGKSTGHIDCKTKQTTSWRSGDYIYKKIDIYKEVREGYSTFEKLPTDASIKFADDLMDSIEPFEFDKLKPFNYSYLSGFLAEKYDVKSQQDEPRAKFRMENSLTNTLMQTIHSSNVTFDINKSFNTELQNEPEYALLPVWMLNTIIENKTYTFAMNGQTGKIIGDIPVSKNKCIIYTLIMLACCFGILTLIYELIFAI